MKPEPGLYLVRQVRDLGPGERDVVRPRPHGAAVPWRGSMYLTVDDPGRPERVRDALIRATDVALSTGRWVYPDA